jgi:hypothetical protein
MEEEAAPPECPLHQWISTVALPIALKKGRQALISGDKNMRLWQPITMALTFTRISPVSSRRRKRRPIKGIYLGCVE